MERELRSDLLALANAYAQAMDREFSTLGRKAAGDWRFFKDLDENTSRFSVRKYDEVMKWFSDNWPADLTWPRSVPRPVASGASERAAS